MHLMYTENCAFKCSRNGATS